MNREEIEKLARESEGTDLAAMLQAKEIAKRNMLGDPSQGNVVAFEKASRLLEARMPSANQKEGKVFKNLAAVLEYLQKAGWKIKKSKLYQDRKNGQPLAQQDGTFLQRDVDAYAISRLERLGGPSDKEDDATRKEKFHLLVAERREKTAKAELAEIKLRVETGELIPKDQVDQQMVAAVTVLRAAMNQFIHTKALEIIHLVGGDPQKDVILVDFFRDESRAFFHGFSKRGQDFEVEYDTDASGVDQDKV